MDNLMNELLITYAEIRRIKQFANKLKNGINFNSSKDLENLYNLTYWTYIIPNDINRSIQLAEIIRSVEFSGDYNKWTWIENISCLAAYLNQMLPNFNEEVFYIEKIKSSLINLSEKELNNELNVIDRLLNNTDLYNKEIQKSINDKNTDFEINWRKNQITKLLFIKMYGGSKIYTDENLEKMINENIEIIRSKINL